MLQSFRGSLPFPAYDGSTALYSGLLIDAAGEKAAFLFQAPNTGTIDQLGWRTMTVTTGATVDVRLETVDAATGFPSGTLWATNTNGSQVVASTDDNTWFNTSLTAGASVNKGQWLAMVIVNPASPGNMNIARVDELLVTSDISPFIAQYTTTWAKQVSYSPVCAVRYSGGNYYAIEGMYPFSNLGSLFFSNSSTPDEIGNIFQMPFPCRVTGFWKAGSTDGDMDVVLYDSNGSTPLLTLAVDKDIHTFTSNAVGVGRFDSTVNLAKDTDYRIVLKPTTTTAVSLLGVSVPAVAMMDALCGGQKVHNTSRTDGGSWSQTTTDRMMIGILFDALDDGAGGGAGGVGPVITRVVAPVGRRE